MDLELKAEWCVARVQSGGLLPHSFARHAHILEFEEILKNTVSKDKKKIENIIVAKSDESMSLRKFQKFGLLECKFQ